MDYEKKQWPLLDKALQRKAQKYDELSKGITDALLTVHSKTQFLKHSGFASSHCERLINGETTPRPATLIRIIQALVNERNNYLLQLRKMNKNGN
jgi:hypothetical protein